MAFKKTFPEPQAFSDKPRPPIPLTPVKSNQVGAIGYDPLTKTLACQFVHVAGHVYHYPNVEPKVHADFMAAKSIGKFFGQHIKALPFEKYEAEPAKDIETKVYHDGTTATGVAPLPEDSPATV